MVLLPAETLGRKNNHVDSLGRMPFFKYSSLGKQQRCGCQTKYDWQSEQETKIGGLVYIL